MLARQCSTIGHFQAVCETGSVLSWIWGSLWGCAGDWVKIHPQNSPKGQYLLQQWPGLKHNLHIANTCCRSWCYTLWVQRIHGKTYCHNETVFIPSFTLHTLITFAAMFSLAQICKKQIWKAAYSITLHVTQWSLTVNVLINAQVMHLSLKAPMPQFPCIFCSLFSPPRFYKSVKMLTCLIYFVMNTWQWMAVPIGEGLCDM